jgi:hypothetical protein
MHNTAVINSLSPHPSRVDPERSTARNFTPSVQVHAMKTEIPPFGSELKDKLVPNDSYSHY